MDNQRFFLWGSLAFVLFLIYQAWVEDYGPKPVADTTPPPAVVDSEIPQEIPSGELPELTAAPEPEAQIELSESPPPVTPSSKRIKVTTDVLDLEIDLTGGDLRRAYILQYPVDKKNPDEVILLLNDNQAQNYLFQSGLLSGADWPSPNHRTNYVSDADEYRLNDGQDTLVVTLTWADARGLSVEKTYTFKRGSYAIDLDYRVSNASDTPWTGASYLQLQRRYQSPKRSLTDVDSYSFTGPVLFDGDSSDKLDVDDLAKSPEQFNTVNGWFAIIQHHFLVAVVPDAEQPNNFEARMLDGNRYLLRSVGPSFQVPAGAESTQSATLFVGPKLQEQLKQVGTKLEYTVDYGVFTIFSQPLFWLLEKIHSVVKNWGWAIILLTVLIKLVFYKLAETSGRSMAKMRKLQPRLKSIQERYKDDREKLSRAMMALYKEEKVNPAAGCLPILVQMPVFLALYWVLLESVELRQAPFALWINDLSVKDPFFILPVLMGASMFFMQKLNPQPADPVQARVMTILPLVMSIFMAFFPAGLVLYWLVNNLLSIAQQWRINKVVEAER